jgi:hypothetical protein
MFSGTAVATPPAPIAADRGRRGGDGTFGADPAGQ